MKQNFIQNLKKFRRENSLSQEGLAEKLGVTSQAVSKWECGLAYPDIELIFNIAELFGCSVDELFGRSEGVCTLDLPDDGVYRIVMCRGSEVVDAKEYREDTVFRIASDRFEQNCNVMLEVHGNASFERDINGSVSAEGNVECRGDIHGMVTAGGNIECQGDICGNVAAGKVACADVGGNVACGGGVCCGDIGGNLNAGGDVLCGDIGGMDSRIDE